jgi:uncharacterized protein with HEPN domain
MSRRDPEVSLRQMRDHAQEVVEFVRGRSRRDLDTDRLLALAVVRLLEIIGEAAGRVPPEEQMRRPGVPWSAIVGLRNRLIHGYDDIDHDIVWQIVTSDLPGLVVELSRALPDPGRTDGEGAA